MRQAKIWNFYIDWQDYRNSDWFTVSGLRPVRIDYYRPAWWKVYFFKLCVEFFIPKK